MNNAKNVLHVIGKENGKNEQMNHQKIVRTGLQACENEEWKKVWMRPPRNVRFVLDLRMSVNVKHAFETYKSIMYLQREIKVEMIHP
jgi:hypothetical protein